MTQNVPDVFLNAFNAPLGDDLPKPDPQDPDTDSTWLGVSLRAATTENWDRFFVVFVAADYRHKDEIRNQHRTRFVLATEGEAIEDVVDIPEYVANTVPFDGLPSVVIANLTPADPLKVLTDPNGVFDLSEGLLGMLGDPSNASTWSLDYVYPCGSHCSEPWYVRFEILTFEVDMEHATAIMEGTDGA